MGRKKIEDLEVSKQKMRELKEYCKQYKSWVQALEDINYIQRSGMSFAKIKSSAIANPTADIAEIKDLLIKNIYVVEKSAVLTDPDVGGLIFLAVTEGWGYDRLNKEKKIPVSKPTYYRLYRRFFWILDKSRKLQMLQ